MSEIIKVENLGRVYSSGTKSLEVLKNVSFSVTKGTSISIVGPSGSGKTTLLGLCAGLDIATHGDVIIAGQSLKSLNEDQRAALRNKHVGFVFQNFQLIPTLNALENVMVPLELNRKPNAEKIASAYLEKVGLGDRKTHYPKQLSGGEQQRVSLARAFANKPEILFADEPTGNLDDETSDKIESLLFGLNQEEGTTLVLVTHDMNLASKTNRVIKLKKGEIFSDSNIEKP